MAPPLSGGFESGRLAAATGRVFRPLVGWNNHRFVFYMDDRGELGALETNADGSGARHLRFDDLRRNTPGIPALDRGSPISACTSAWGEPMVAVRSWTTDDLILLYRVSQAYQPAVANAADYTPYWSFFRAPSRFFNQFGFGDPAVGGGLLCVPGVKGPSDGGANIWGVDQGQLNFGNPAVATTDYVAMTSPDGHVYRLDINGAVLSPPGVSVLSTWVPASYNWEDYGPLFADLPGYRIDTSSDCLVGRWFPGGGALVPVPAGLHLYLRIFDAKGRPRCAQIVDNFVGIGGRTWQDISQGDGLQDNWPTNRLVLSGTPGLASALQPGFYPDPAGFNVVLWSSNPYFWDALVDLPFPVVANCNFSGGGGRPLYAWADGTPPA